MVGLSCPMTWWYRTPRAAPDAWRLTSSGKDEHRESIFCYRSCLVFEGALPPGTLSSLVGAHSSWCATFLSTLYQNDGLHLRWAKIRPRVWSSGNVSGALGYQKSDHCFPGLLHRSDWYQHWRSCAYLSSESGSFTGQFSSIDCPQRLEYSL